MSVAAIIFFVDSGMPCSDLGVARSAEPGLPIRLDIIDQAIARVGPD
jgi:hypothetical protein